MLFTAVAVQRNAACKLCGVALKKEGDFLLSVENSSLPVKISENNYVPTDKAEPHLHGFGLQNIAHIMQKYGYEYTLFYHDARFHFVSILS